MSNRSILNTLFSSLLLTVLALSPSPLMAKSDGPDRVQMQRFVIELLDPPLAAYMGQPLSAPNADGELMMAPTAPIARGERRLDVRSVPAEAYMKFLVERQRVFLAKARETLGRDIEVSYRYQAVSNGLALVLSQAEADELAKSPLIQSITADERQRIDTYAGPRWIGAETLWNGDAGIQARGEGVLVGVIDTGINWDHPSFEESSSDGYSHTNPFASGLGLCSMEEVKCNNKLVGVYDFVQDDPSTEDVEEENTNGKDNNGHGSHTAGIAVGNPVQVLVNDTILTEVSGVAPRANLIAYRTCYQGVPSGPDSAGCDGSAAIQAIDQAIKDGVDVINYSVGGSARDPWRTGSVDRAFLNARNAGVFVASSAGNAGPGAETVGSPANAPWLVAVGNATHNTVPGSAIQNMSGGATAAPADMVGASLTSGTGNLTVVHAKDYGNALCGEGPAESGRTCGENTGVSSPWGGEQVFNGEIVVCDRGTYGRVEKGKNVLLAGAGGYILANTAEFGEDLVPDEHCLPATHIGKKDGDVLRAWLDSGSGHRASLSGLILAETDAVADRLRISSSRGPALPPVEDTLKPNVIAPGSDILAASNIGSSFRELTGTSMASPHVAGAAALLKSARPEWTPAQLVSAIETTATQHLAKDWDGGPATTSQVGAGRPQLDEAVNTGLFLNVTGPEFTVANPSFAGNPKGLNLPGLVDATCGNSCSFTRTLTDHGGGGNWTVQAVGFPASTQVTVSPQNFNLGAGDSQEIEVTVKLASSVVIGGWASGKIQLSAPGYPDQFLTVNAKFPDSWEIDDDRSGGWESFSIAGLPAMPDATFTVGGLVREDRTVEVLQEDPSNSEPYDGGAGIMTKWYDAPNGIMWLYAETLTSTADDLDLFVGRDIDGNGQPSEDEELCTSTSPEELERCDLYDLPAGRYWIIVQNWTAGASGGDEATLLSAAIQSGADFSLAASGPGMTAVDEAFHVRLSWDNLKALPGESWVGAVGVGTSRSTPNSVGIIPVYFQRTAAAAEAATLPLMMGRKHGLALDAGGRHDRIFIDVPPGASSLTVNAAGSQNENLTLELVRMDFDAALANPPFTAPASGDVVASGAGTGSNGPSLTVDNVQAGRWYAVLKNNGGSSAAVDVQADITFSGEPFDVHPGLWEPRSRPGLAQGYDFNRGGSSQVLIWYTYDEDGQPAWYIANAPVAAHNVWTADLLRVTNDGAEQQAAVVGAISVTSLAGDDALFSYTLFGRSATERMMPLSPLTCPGSTNHTGIWFRGVDGLGGASVLINASTQAQIHYLFDADGLPRWLFAQDLVSPSPDNSEIPMLQISGYCAVCDPAPIVTEEVGVLQRSFDSATSGSWTLDYLFRAPLSGSVERTDPIIKLTDSLGCP